MTALELLDSLINDAYRNGRDDAKAALQLMREPVARLEADRDLLRIRVDHLEALRDLGE